MVFQSKIHDWEDVLDRATRMKTQYHIFLETPVVYGPQPSSVYLWQPPSNGILKVNVDAAVFQYSHLYGVGMVGA